MPAIHRPETQGVRFFFTVIAARRPLGACVKQLAVYLVVIIHWLEAIHFILVHAAAQGQLVRPQVHIKIQFDALGLVVPVVVLVLQTLDILGAVQHALGVFVTGVGAVDKRTAAVELEPVTGKFVVVAGGGHANGVGEA